MSIKPLFRMICRFALLSLALGCGTTSVEHGGLDGDPDRALMEGDYSSAINIYSRKLQESPDDANLNYKLGLAFYRMGEAFADDPDLGGDPASAFADGARYFEKGLVLEPKHREAGIMFARALFMNNDLRGAYEAIERSLERYPGDAEALEAAAQIGITIARQAAPDEAKNYRDRAVSRLKRAIEMDPGLDRAYLRLGDYYLQEEQFDLATQNYMKGIEACAFSNTLQERLLYCYQAQTGIEPGAAISFYDSLLGRQAALPPEDQARLWWFKGTWYSHKAMVHYKGEEFDLAAQAFGKHLECLEKCKTLYEGFKAGAEDIAAAVRVNRGWCHLNLDRFDEAEEDILAALTHDPENERTIFAVDSLGYAVSQKKGLEGARDFFKRLTAHYGKRHQWWNDYGFFSLEANMQSDEPDSKYQETLDIYERALELLPDYPRYVNDAAMVIDYYLDPEGVRSGEVEAMYKKAWKMGKEKYESPFTDDLEKTVMYSAFTDALVNLGRMYLLQGRLDECGTVLGELLETAPDRPEAAQLDKAYKEALGKNASGGKS